MIYVPAGSVRAAYTFKDQPMHAYPFNFHWAEPNNHIPLPFGIVTKNMITKEILDYIREFKQVWMNQQPLYTVQARAIFELIIHRLLINYYRKSTNIIDLRIKKVMSYISDHYSENITITEMAEMVGLHPVYFGKLFKQNTGLTFKEYVNRIRINNAEMMLSSGDFTVTETAERCGFSDIFYFSESVQVAERVSAFSSETNMIDPRMKAFYKRKSPLRCLRWGLSLFPIRFVIQQVSHPQFKSSHTSSTAAWNGALYFSISVDTDTPLVSSSTNS